MRPNCCKRHCDEITERKAQILALPRANLHGDLFRDNAMFEGTHLTGLIDFYNACSGPMLYDVAIALNDWCADEDGHLDAPVPVPCWVPMRAAPVYRQRSRVVADHAARCLCAFLAVAPDCSPNVCRPGRTDSRPGRVRTPVGRCAKT
jgi:aminoglycoside phosphotransferase (APT) family kinase protein